MQDLSVLSCAIAALTACLLAFVLSQPTSLARWLQKKKYQYEVTFSLYMLTPTEKFIFNSIIFLFLSMVLIACALYLPRHLSVVARRAYYYYAGDTSLLQTSQKAAENFVQQASKAANDWLGAATQRLAVNNTAAAAVEAWAGSSGADDAVATATAAAAAAGVDGA